MKKNALVFDVDNFEEILVKVSDGNIGIRNDSSGWFYIVTEEVEGTDEEIYSLIGKELNVIVTDIIVDISNFKVAIIYD